MNNKMVIESAVSLRGTFVRIQWHSVDDDWPYFLILAVNELAEEIRLRGQDYPDGSAKHDGSSFWVSARKIASIEKWVPPSASEARPHGAGGDIPAVDTEAEFKRITWYRAMSRAEAAILELLPSPSSPRGRDEPMQDYIDRARKDLDRLIEQYRISHKEFVALGGKLRA